MRAPATSMLVLLAFLWCFLLFVSIKLKPFSKAKTVCGYVQYALFLVSFANWECLIHSNSCDMLTFPFVSRQKSQKPDGQFFHVHFTRGSENLHARLTLGCQVWRARGCTCSQNINTNPISVKLFLSAMLTCALFFFRAFGQTASVFWPFSSVFPFKSSKWCWAASRTGDRSPPAALRSRKGRLGFLFFWLVADSRWRLLVFSFQNPCPEEDASFLSNFFFFWFSG